MGDEVPPFRNSCYPNETVNFYIDFSSVHNYWLEEIVTRYRFLFGVCVVIFICVFTSAKWYKQQHNDQACFTEPKNKDHAFLEEFEISCDIRSSSKIKGRASSCCVLTSFSPEEINNFDVSDIKELVDNEDKAYAQQEDANEYRHGGYMPISLNNILDDKYQVIRKLGYGHFSTVWLCENILDKEYVAIKICKSADIFTSVAADEIKLLQCTKDKNSDHIGSKNIVQMLDFFSCHSIHGTHTAIAFEIMGPSLLHLIIQSEYQGIQLAGVRNIVKQVLQGLHFLHDECSIIHTDIKPENILIKVKRPYVDRMVKTARKFHDMGVRMPKSYVAADLSETSEEDDTTLLSRRKSYPETSPIKDSPKNCSQGVLKGPIWIDGSIEVKIADLGNACWDDLHYSSEIQTKQYRALEVIMEAGYSFPADIWSLGCVAFELATGEYLFNPKSYERCSATEDHLSLIWEVLDGIPSYITSRGNNSLRYFNSGQLRHVGETFLKIWRIEDVLVEKYEWKRVDAIPFASFIESMIEPDPELRVTAIGALSSDWINDLNDQS